MNRRFTFLFSLVLFLSSQLFAQQVPQVSTFFGNGLPETINAPGSFDFDSNGNMYVIQDNGDILRITPAGVSSLYYDNTDPLVSSLGSVIHIDVANNVYFTIGTSIVKRTGISNVELIAGDKSQTGYVDNNQINNPNVARFYNITDICSDLFGNLFVCENYVPSGLFLYNSRIRRITPSNKKVETFYSHSGAIVSICFDNNANLILAKNASIYKLNVFTKTETLVAGNETEFGAANGNGAAARFGPINNVAVNSANEIIVSQGSNIIIYATQFFVAVSSGGGTLNLPTDNRKIRKISPSNDVSDIAGSTMGFKDAVGKDANFSSWPIVELNASGDIFISDRFNHRIRKITYVTPPPAPNPVYIDMPATMCLGSTISQDPAITGSEMHLKLSVDTLDVLSNFKAITKNDNFIYVVNTDDMIYKYTLDGDSLGPLSFFNANTTAIAADNLNRLYIVASDNVNPSLTSVYRINSSGGIDFSWNSGQTTSSVLNHVSTIAIGKDNIAYVADTTTGYISQLDTLDASVINLPFPSNLQYSYSKPVSMAFDVEGNMFLADKGNNKILKRDPNDNNYYDVYPGIENEGLKIDGISFDHGAGYTYLISSERDTVYMLTASSELDTSGSAKGFTNQSFLNAYTTISNPKQLVAATGGFASNVYLGSSTSNNVTKLSVYSMRISPKLPRGLFFDHMNGGKIYGTPQVTAPYTTYTITSYGVVDSTLQTISFSVDPSSLTANTLGNKTSPIINVQAGLSVNFYDGAGCEPLAEITPVTGAQGAGNVQVTRTVEASLPSFNTGGGTTQFIRSKIKVSSQNPDTTNVNLVQYFTYQDIEHYNANNGTQSDLQNDTVVGTMPITIVQLHEKSNGSKEVIKHNVVAKWSSAKKVWKAEVRLTKFSEFYGTSQDAATTFECESQESYEFAFGCASAEFGGQTYYTSGNYRLEYINQYGCDSIINLSVFVDNSVEIGMYGEDTLKLQQPASGATFQWVSCDNNFEPISGAFDSLLVVADSGNYAVIVTSGGCIDTSNCAHINLYQTAGIDDNGNIYAFSISPNPSQGMFVLNSSFSDLKLEVFNLLGESILKGSSNNGVSHINLSDAPSGMYIVKIQADGMNIVHQIVKQ